MNFYKILLISFFFFFLKFDDFGQSITLGFDTNFGIYKMDNMKKIVETVNSSLPFESKIVSNFPPFYSFSPKVNINFKKVGIGIFAGYKSTGARISSLDYSGEYIGDFTVEARSIGLKLEMVDISKKFEVIPYLSGGIDYNKIKAEDKLIIGDNVLQEEQNSFTSSGYFTEIGIRPTLRHKRLNLSGIFGFSYSFENKKELYPNWTGLRFGISLGLVLSK